MGEGGPAAIERALADTSLFIAIEQLRPLAGPAPRAVTVSVVTIGELRLGVLAASDERVRSTRRATLTQAMSFDPLPVDDPVAQAWAQLQRALANEGRRMERNDSWIAATAIAHGLPLATQDDGFDDVPGLAVVKL